MKAELLGPPPLKFEPIKIVLTITTKAELEEVEEELGHLCGDGTYPLYDLISDLNERLI